MGSSNELILRILNCSFMKIFLKNRFLPPLVTIITLKLPSCYKMSQFQFTWKKWFRELKMRTNVQGSFCILAHFKRYKSSLLIYFPWQKKLFKIQKLMWIGNIYFIQVTSECEQRMVGDHLQVLHSECKPMVAKEMKKGN